MDDGGSYIMTPEEAKKNMTLDEKRGEEDFKRNYQKLQDYFITSGYVYDDLRLFRLDVYSFDIEHLHLPQVRFTIRPRSQKRLDGPKFILTCDKLKISFVKVIEEDGDVFVRVRGLCDIDVAEELKKLIIDYENSKTTKPPKGE